MADRYVLLGAAPPRAAWFQTVGRWASSKALPAEFLRCVSLDELRLRLRSGRPHSAVLIDGELPGVDRDLLAEARQLGVAVLIVDDRRRREWRELGATAVLARQLSRDELLEVLSSSARPVGAADLPAPPVAGIETDVGGSALVAVTGPGGTGASSLAIALAQGLAQAGPDGDRPAVLLADLCRAADQALFHDSQVVVPSIQELVDGHRAATPDPAEVRAATFAVPARGYRLVLGLRRPRAWVTLQQRAVEQTLRSLQRLADIVVADVDPDVEGEAETGSVDIAERNALSRAALRQASVTVLVLEPSLKGVHAGVRVVSEHASFGTPLDRIVPVVNRAPRSPRARAELTAALGELTAASVGPSAGRLAPPVFVPERAVDRMHRDVSSFPSSVTAPLARAVAAARARAASPRALHQGPAPVPVVPGSLSAFTGGGTT
jgi:Mrp family chromosome partitioning ATPase